MSLRRTVARGLRFSLGDFNVIPFPAALSSIGVFVYVTYVGFGGLALAASLRPQKHRASNRVSPLLMLITPALGFSLVLLPTLWANWAGLPVGSFAIPLAVALFVVASIAIVRHPPRPNWRLMGVFGAVLALAFWLTGRPLVEYGFDWLSFSNDDMTNYSLAAERLIAHGFFSIPNRHDFVYQSDTPLYYWVLYAVEQIRTGVEELLASAAVILHVSTFAAFMPLIMAMHLMLISSSAALVYQGPRRKAAAILTALALALSAGTSLGTIYQLIAQVCGLGLLLASLAVIQLTLRRPSRRGVVIAAVIVTALFAVYPEVSPFLFLGTAIVLTLRVLRGQTDLRRAAKSIAGVALLTLILGNANLRTFLNTALTQTAGGTRSVGEHLFWYMLLPGAPATLFGLIPIATRPDGDFVSIAVAVGFALLFMLLALVCFAMRARAEALSAVAAVMLALGAFLAWRQADFGLLKLSMYMQPFLWGMLAVAVTSGTRKRVLP